MKLEGTTTVRVLVSTEGRPQRVALERARALGCSTRPRWRRCANGPSSRRGKDNKAMAAEVDVPVRFRLTGATVVPPDGDSK